VPFTPVLEAHHSERRDVIKGRIPTVPCTPSPSARRSADDHVAVALARGRARAYLRNCLVDIGTTNHDCVFNAIITPREQHDFFERWDDE
jgi:hypothetical protein